MKFLGLFISKVKVQPLNSHIRTRILHQGWHQILFRVRSEVEYSVETQNGSRIYSQVLFRIDSSLVEIEAQIRSQVQEAIT